MLHYAARRRIIKLTQVQDFLSGVALHASPRYSDDRARRVLRMRWDAFPYRVQEQLDRLHNPYRDPFRSSILDALDRGFTPVAQLAETIGLNRSTLDLALVSLQRDGAVVVLDLPTVGRVAALK